MPGEVRGREPLLRRRPVELVAHAEQAAVDEHGAGDRPGVTGRQLERHHRAPRVADHDRAAERRPARDGQRVGRDVVEAVATVRLRTQAMPTRVERHHAEPSGETGHDPVPDALRRRQAVVQQQAGSIGRGRGVHPHRQPDATVADDDRARHLGHTAQHGRRIPLPAHRRRQRREGRDRHRRRHRHRPGDRARARAHRGARRDLRQTRRADRRRTRRARGRRARGALGRLRCARVRPGRRVPRERRRALRPGGRAREQRGRAVRRGRRGHLAQGTPGRAPAERRRRVAPHARGGHAVDDPATERGRSSSSGSALAAASR